MRAAMITAFTGPEAVEIREAPAPDPGPDQVMVDVEYAGVAFPDVLHTRGKYQLPLPDNVPFDKGAALPRTT